MRDDASVFSALSASGIPGTRHAWPKGNAPDLPWFTYDLEDDGLMTADDSNWSNLPVYRASLYERTRDPETEASFEQALSAIGPHTREEYDLDDEKCVMTTYTFTFTGGSNG